MTDVKKSIYALIANILEVNIDVIHDELAIGDIKEWDSLGHIKIIAGIETEMGIILDIEQTLEIEDVEDIIEAVVANKMS
jgi:acyl carrier protein